MFEFTSRSDFRGLGDTKNQLERAELSISNNIAEGVERGTTTELIQFLYIARGSAGECRSMLRVCERVERFSDLKFEISDLIGRVTNISRQLHGWLESLKNSDIKGVKFFTNKEKNKIAKNKEFEEFDQKMGRYKAELEEMLRQRSGTTERGES